MFNRFMSSKGFDQELRPILSRHTYLAQGVALIKKDAPPGRGLPLHSGLLNLAIPQNVGNSGVLFMVAEICVRAISYKTNVKKSK